MVVLRLYAKKIEKDIPFIKSAFFVPKATGRVYVEADAEIPVRELCKGLYFMYCTSIMSVPILERVALLSPGPNQSSLRQGDLVKVRNGMYRNDIGEVVSFSEDEKKRIIVKIKSREPFPTEQKRKRGRRPQYQMDREHILRLKLACRKSRSSDTPLRIEDLGEAGFRIQGRNYTADGYFLLDIRSDRVQRTEMEGVAYTAVVRDESGRAGVRQQRAPQDRFIQPGDPVRIMDGPYINTTGFLTETTDDVRALVSLKRFARENKRSVFVEVELRSLVRAFEIGEVVDVKIGEHLGRTGFVSGMKGNNLYIVDPQQGSEFEISALFVAAHVPSTSSAYHTVSRGERQIKLGCSVIIQRGKHSGKSGIVTLIEGTRVNMIEDGTNTELAVHLDNLRRSEKNPEHQSRFLQNHWQENPPGINHEPKQVASSATTGDDSCSTDHSTEGFEGQLVYTWQGFYKGKSGYVVRVSGALARVNVASAMHCGSILDIPAYCLLARCGCVVATGVVIPWSDKEKAGIPSLFRLLSGQSITPPREFSVRPFLDELPIPKFHDPGREGMWLFDERVAKHRRTFNLVVKIEYHRNTHVSGLREGRVLAEPNPLRHPLPTSTAPTVRVQYSDDTQDGRVEDMHVAALRMTSRLRDKGVHLVVKGERIGMLVTHIKSDFTMARVYPLGQHRSAAFYMEKGSLCVVESPQGE
ncbi:hypothetical protein SCHPADRAFT_344004 [Schizopora paradoxa]|uniref:Chromatin elongation factor SPT5 n=1 Tax=Schizopora paradoxa TaxID=27342 RepID=A0A0H2RPN0_9AGAM|nr:hypothetical protein SCHPADRAFT_344004 [Schizopora paradoxa]